MYCPKDDEELNAIAEDIVIDAERAEKECSIPSDAEIERQYREYCMASEEHLCHQIELDAERRADIMRGK
jgi:hypothetical protein